MRSLIVSHAAAVLLMASTGSSAAAAPRSPAPATASQFATVEKDASTGAWWFQRGSERFLSQGVSNLNDGGLDDGVGDVLGRECRHQQNTKLCGDTNNWDMVLHYSPYHSVTQAKFNGSAERWAADAAARLQGWHFNTISGYSSAVAEQAVGSIGMFYNRLLMFATNFAMPGGTLLQQSTAGGCFCHDVFSEEFVNASDAYAKANVLPRANDTALLGWHFEKEVQWSSMNLRYWLNPNIFPAGSPGQAAALAFVKARYGGQIAKVNAAWGCEASSFEELHACLNPPAAGKGWSCERVSMPEGAKAGQLTSDSEAFILIFAKRYFDVVTAAIRRYDTNHMLFGMRGGCFGSPYILPLFASYIDVYDVHMYNDNLGVKGLLAEYELVHNITGLPIIHGEFSYTAIDSGVPNLRGARSCPHPPNCEPNHPFVLQKDRASQAKVQVATIAAVPYVVGYHWWRWVDETPGGRWPRGENSNYGLVRVDNEAYPELTEAFTEANAAATVAHGQL